MACWRAAQSGCGTTHGPLSTQTALLQLLEQVKTAVDHDATPLTKGGRSGRPGSFMEITILSNIQANNPAYRDEFFGPVVSFYRVKDEEAAIALANDSDFGLGGSVWTKDLDRGKRVASRIDTGMVFVNNIDRTASICPLAVLRIQDEAVSWAAWVSRSL